MDTLTISLTFGVVPPTDEISYFGGEIEMAHTGDVGFYEDGSYWCDGSITATTPDFESDATRTRTDSSTVQSDVHGWSVNPGNAEQDREGDISTLALRQNANYGTGTNIVDQSLDGLDEGLTSGQPYDAALRPALPVSSGTLLKAKSNTSNVSTNKFRNAVEFLAPVTLVSSAPASGSIRPPISRADKTPILNTSTLDLDVLRNLDAGLLANPPISYSAAIEAVSILDPLQSCFNPFSRNVFARNVAGSTKTNYGGDVAIEWSQIMLAMHTNAFTDSQKIELAKKLGALAGDVASRVNEGGIFQPNGGHCARHLPLVAFVAELFDSQYLRDAAGVVAAAKRVNVIAEGASVYGDLNQLKYITQADIDYSAGKRLPYPQAMLGYPEWSNEMWLGMIDDNDQVEKCNGNWMGNTNSGQNNAGQGNSISYNSVVGKSVTAFSLAIRLLQNSSPEVPQLYHDYADRYAYWAINGHSAAEANNYIYPVDTAETDYPTEESSSNSTPAWVKNAYAEWSSLVTVWTP